MQPFIHEQELFYKFIQESLKSITRNETQTSKLPKNQKQNSVFTFDEVQESKFQSNQSKFAFNKMKKLGGQKLQFKIDENMKSSSVEKIQEDNNIIQKQETQSPVTKVKISIKRNEQNEIYLQKQEHELIHNSESEIDLIDDKVSMKSNTFQRQNKSRGMTLYRIDTSKDIVNTDWILRTLEKNKITNQNFINAILMIERELKSVNIKYRIQLAEQTLLNEQFKEKINQLELIINSNNKTNVQISSFIKKQAEFYGIQEENKEVTNQQSENKKARWLNIYKNRKIQKQSTLKIEDQPSLSRNSISVTQTNQLNLLRTPTINNKLLKKRDTGFISYQKVDDTDEIKSQISMTSLESQSQFDGQSSNKDDDNSDNPQVKNIKDSLKLFMPMFNGISDDTSIKNWTFYGPEHLLNKDWILLKYKAGSPNATQFAHKILLNTEIIKSKKIFKANSLLKIISNIYKHQLHSIQKGNSLKTELLFLIYDQFESQYGFVKNSAEAKLIQVLKVARSYSAIPKIRLFLKFIKIIPIIENSKFSIDITDFQTYLEYLIFIDETTNQTEKAGLSFLMEKTETIYGSFQKILDYFMKFYSENFSLFSFIESQEVVINKLKAQKIPDPFNRNKSKIDIDIAFELFMELKFRSLDKVFSTITKIADYSDHGLISANEFTILIRTIEQNKYSLPEISDFFIKYAYIQNVQTNQQYLSYNEFAKLCLNFKLFTQQQQDKFLTSNLIKEVKNFQELQTQWYYQQDVIKLKLINSKMFLQFYIKQLNCIDETISQKDDDQTKQIEDFQREIWMRYRIVDEEAQFFILQIELNTLLPQEFIAFSNLKISVPQPLAPQRRPSFCVL